MDKEQIKAELKAELRAELEAELRAEMLEEARAQRMNASLETQVRSARQEAGWERQGVRNAQVTDSARMIGEVLAEQMLAGMPGTHINDDGFGDGTA